MAGSSELEPERAGGLAELARELFAAVDRASRPEGVDPPEQMEAQVEGGAVYASRTPRWILAVVARRTALSSLMLMDLRAVLAELETGVPIHISTSAVANGDSLPISPMPNLDPEDAEAT